MIQKESFEKTKSWLEGELANRTNISPEISGVIFIGLTNRTNTGALATTLGRAPTNFPITRHIQPFKAIARQIMEARGVAASTPLTFLRDHIDLGTGIHLVKETIGPNKVNPAEWVDSMKILLERGIDPTKMTFIPTFRDPLDTIASWKFMWGWSWSDFPFDSFNQSFRIVSENINFAKSVGVNVVPYVHEFLRDFDRFDVIERMCGKIGIPFHENMVQWHNPNSSGNGNADWYFEGNIVKYDQPPERWIRGAMSIEHGGRGGLIWKPIGPKLQLTAEEKEFVRANIQPALEIHEESVAKARQTLGFDEFKQEV